MHVQNQKLVLAEKKITISMIFYISKFNEWFIKNIKINFYYIEKNIGGYLMSWTPYACVLLFNSFKTPTETYPIISNITAVFSKSSLVWSTLVYILMNENIKSKIFIKKASSSRNPNEGKKVLNIETYLKSNRNK